MIERLLRMAVEKGASDLHITVGVSPALRLNGKLVRTGGAPLTAQDIGAMLETIALPQQLEKLRQNGEVDFSFSIPQLSRFRVNGFRQRGAPAIAVRVIKEQIATLDELGHSEILQALTRLPRGLVIVTGPTGSGKSATLAAMIDSVNNERACHVLTLEDPIEYLHQHKQCIVNQREIQVDSQSFANALRAALRQNPDIILIGEMRDIETVGAAVTAAETGHLVFATLHTCDAAQTIDRIIDVFPPHQQQQIRIQLSLTLQGIISQQLLTRLDGAGRALACEILIVTPAVRNLIREGNTHQIASVIQTGARFGMQTMDACLCDLFRRGIISYKDALERSTSQEAFIRLVNS